VKDLVTKKEATFTKTFEVVPSSFGLVRMALSIDDAGRLPAPPLCVPGQRLFVNFYVTGFDRDKTSKEPHITFKMRVKEKGTAVLGKDSGGAIKDAPEKYKMIQANFQLQLNRPGQFSVELEATDEVAKKSVSYSFNVVVQELLK
jgi:hypothetical protein